MTYALHFLFYGKGRMSDRWHSRASGMYLIATVSSRAGSAASIMRPCSYASRNARMV